MVFTVSGDVHIWNQSPQHLTGMDFRTIYLLSENHMLPFKLPNWQNVVPRIMKEVLNPLDPDAPAVEYSDNEQQLEVIRHHYRSEFDAGHIREVIKDYDRDAAIYEVLDEVPKTYHGRCGVRQMCRDVLGKVQNIELQHVAINGNHAQVVWMGETKMPSPNVIVGTDSFTFNDDNRITSQTIVALTRKENKSSFPN
jgi:hypothetical protein